MDTTALAFYKMAPNELERGYAMHGVNNLADVVTAVGGLGTAAFGVVDASKILWGGVNHIGFAGIERTMRALLPVPLATPSTALGAGAADSAIATLKANWFNGTDLASQKAIAKSLIHLHLNVDSAPALASVTGVDPSALAAIARHMASATSLDSAQADVFARFDMIVTTLLDGAYLRADQMYRSWTRALATLVAIGLALCGAAVLHAKTDPWTLDLLEATLAGLLATPLAPIAKDLSTALATAVNALQLVKK
jgi:hypothetical protein